jgi:E3 ubiquitin-protein ligase SIAH1
MHPNLALAGIIQELEVYCRYRAYGCTLTMQLDAKESHEKTCVHAPARCPNFIHGCGYEGATRARVWCEVHGGPLSVWACRW